MVRLSDAARWQLVVTVFFAACVLPTLGLLGWIVWRHLPGHSRYEAARLERALGLRVSIQRVEHPAPGRIVYRDVELSDPETGRGVLRCDRIQAAWQKPAGDEIENSRLLVIALAAPEINAAEAGNLWPAIERQLTGRAAAGRLGMRLSAGELTIHTQKGAERVNDIQASLDHLQAGTQAQLSFAIDGQAVTEPATVRIGRNHQATPPTTGFELYTGSSPMPASLVAVGLPGMGPLGEEAGFHGYIWANQRPTGWEGEMTGQWLDVDLDRIITDHFDHTLTGLARLAIQRMRFVDGRVEEAAGTVSAGPGMVSRSMLEAVARHLDFDGVARPSAPGQPIPYEQLAFSFSLDSGGLEIVGQCAGAAAGAVMLDSRSRLLGQPTQAQPVADLLQALYPPSRHQIPALRQTNWLARRLPLPLTPTQPAQAAGDTAAYSPSAMGSYRPEESAEAPGTTVAGQERPGDENVSVYVPGPASRRDRSVYASRETEPPATAYGRSVPVDGPADSGYGSNGDSEQNAGVPSAYGRYR